MPARELGEQRLLSAVETDAVEQLGGLLGEFGAAKPGQAAVEPHRLAGGQLGGKVGLLGQEAETRASTGRPRGHAENLEPAAARLDESEQHLQRRGLAGAVGAEKPVDRAPRHGDGHVGDRLAATAGDPAVVLARVLDEDRRSSSAARTSP